MEKNFDSRAILNGVFDFVTCQRPDGSYYGAGGAKCHKGSESELPASEDKSGRLSARATGVAQKLTKLQLEQYNIKDAEQANRDSAVFQQELAKQVERLQKGEVSKAEIDELLVKHLDYDIANSEFVFIGMENALEADRAGQNGAESAGQWSLANQLAVKSLSDGGMSSQRLTNAGMIEDRAVDNLAGNLKNNVLGSNSYVSNSAYLAAQATGTKLSGPGITQEEASAFYFGGNKLATIEMSSLAASTIGDGSLSQAGSPKVSSKGINSADPNRSAYGALINGQAGSQFTGYSREYVRKEFNEQRASYIGKELTKAADNPRFQGGFGAPGSGSKYTQFTKEVIDPLARQGMPTYTTKVPLSTNTKRADGDTKRGTIKGGVQTINHTMHVVEVAPGKYFVSGDLSMNSNGYSANNNHFKAYSQAITNVKNGTATKYTPPSQKAAAPKTSSATKASTARKQAQSSRQSTKRTASATKKEAQQRAKRIGKEMKAAIKERDGTKPGSPRNVAAREQLTTLKAQLKTAEAEAK